MTEFHDTILNVLRFGGKTVSITEKISGNFIVSVSRNIQIGTHLNPLCSGVYCEWEQKQRHEDYSPQGLEGAGLGKKYKE